MSGVKDGLVWWWDLNSADATITDQHSGLVLTRHQTPTTVVGGAPDGGDCISFGTAQGKYRNASVPKTIAYERGFSANCWVFTTGSSTFGNRLINHRDLAAPNQYFQMGVIHPTVGDWGEVFSASGASRAATSGVPASPLNTWVMLTYVDNGSTSSLYRNGVLVATGSTAIGALATANAPLAIGGHAWQTINDSSLDHRGRMAMTGVWDRPLTADEITWLFNSGTGRRYNSLTFGERDLGGEVLWICPTHDDIGVGTVVARDLTTNRNHGILTNMDPPTDWVSDTANGGTRALDFDGVNDYVRIGDVLDSAFVGAAARFTVAAWIYPTENGNRVIIAKNADSNFAENQRQWDFRYTSGQLDFVWFGDLLAANFRLVRSTATIPLNTWTHVAATFDAAIANADQKVNLFINGESASYTIPITGGSPVSIQNATAPLAIGAMVNSAGTSSFQNFQGRIDDARIFNRILTQTEITALASQRGYQRPVVNGIGDEALWICPSLDTIGNGTLLARDLSNQRNHGTLTNMDAASDWVADAASGGVRALDFDGVNDFVNVPDSGVIRAIGSHSLSFWIRGSDNTNKVIFEKGVNALLVFQPNGPNQLFYLDGNASPANVTNIVTSFIDGNWHHVTLVFNGTNRFLFVDSVQRHTSVMSPLVANTNPLVIGSRSGSFPFQGRLDDIRYFPRAISALEIATLASQRGYNLPSNTRRRRYAGAYGL